MDFDQVVAEHRGELLAHCYRMLGSPEDAEDALQEALLGAWKGYPGFEGRSSVRTWLYAITTNACLKQAKRRFTTPELVPALNQTLDLGAPDTEHAFVEPWATDPSRPTSTGSRWSWRTCRRFSGFRPLSGRC